jgi:hypothetical protein
MFLNILVAIRLVDPARDAVRDEHGRPITDDAVLNVTAPRRVDRRRNARNSSPRLAQVPSDGEEFVAALAQALVDDVAAVSFRLARDARPATRLWKNTFMRCRLMCEPSTTVTRGHLIFFSRMREILAQLAEGSAA